MGYLVFLMAVDNFNIFIGGSFKRYVTFIALAFSSHAWS